MNDTKDKTEHIKIRNKRFLEAASQHFRIYEEDGLIILEHLLVNGTQITYPFRPDEDYYEELKRMSATDDEELVDALDWFVFNGDYPNTPLRTLREVTDLVLQTEDSDEDLKHSGVVIEEGWISSVSSTLWYTKNPYIFADKSECMMEYARFSSAFKKKEVQGYIRKIKKWKPVLSTEASHQQIAETVKTFLYHPEQKYPQGMIEGKLDELKYMLDQTVKDWWESADWKDDFCELGEVEKFVWSIDKIEKGEA